MAKKQTPPKLKEIKKAPDKRFWILAAIVFVVSFIFYGSSINNEYALDDGITMEKNEYVHQGIDGIGSIMTKDAMASFFKQVGSKGQLSGGRYRPLSIVTFALEYEFFGFSPGDNITITGTDGKNYKGKIKKITPDGEVFFVTKEFGEGRQNITKVHEFKRLAHIQHFFNVFLFAISMVVLFYFLYKILLKNLNHAELWALFITLVFTMHPLHTEVVANIKSRDEILSLLFILLTLIQLDKYLNTKKPLYLAYLGICFFLAMLSKEYGAVLLIIVPVWVYLKQNKLNWLELVMVITPLVFAFLPYYLLRTNAVMVAGPDDVKPDVLNDYYLFAQGDEKRATQVYILLKYFLLQIFPYPLASDYSFRTIAFRHFTSPEVIISIVFHVFLVGGLVYAFIKKNIIVVFGLSFYLFNLVLVSNLVFNIGASMGERLVYHSSLGLILLIFYGLYQLVGKNKKTKTSIYAAGGFTTLVAIPFFIVTQQRNAAWKNDYTLAITDVKTHPNSALLNANACSYTVHKSEEFANKDKEMAMTLEAKQYCLKALEIHPDFANAWMNMAVLEHKLKNYEAAELAVKKVIEIFPNNPKVPLFKNMVAMDYVNVGFEKYKEGKVDSCFVYLYKAKKLDPANPEVLYNLGGAYLTAAKNSDSAMYYFSETLKINPNHPGAQQGYGSIMQNAK